MCVERGLQKGLDLIRVGIALMLRHINQQAGGLFWSRSMDNACSIVLYCILDLQQHVV